MLVLRDRLGLTDQVATVSAPVATLLSLCDGTRDVDQLRTAFELHTGIAITGDRLRKVLTELDSALLFEGPRVEQLKTARLAQYRAQPFRSPALAGQAYPADPDECRDVLATFGDHTGSRDKAASAGPIQGLVSPHIDYQRGGPVYHQTWQLAASAVRAAELVIILGTDHHGSAGQLTPTRLPYATPFGPLPLALDIVDAMETAMGTGPAYDEELHHEQEHSIELSAVWLHSFVVDRPPAVLPVLCGSFHEYTAGTKHPSDSRVLEAAIQVLRQAVRTRRTLVVAAADLAHVGPAFGDALPFDATAREDVARADASALEATCAGDAEGFLATVCAIQDRYRVCGVPPIYLALRILDNVEGDLVDYRFCPADASGSSWVTVAGVALASAPSGARDAHGPAGGARFR